MLSRLPNPYLFFTETDGSALDAGYIYIGQEGVNPELTQIAVYSDYDMQSPIPQPIRTVAGKPAVNGNMINIFPSSSLVSITVRNKNNELVFSDLYFSNNNAALKFRGTFDDDLTYDMGDIVTITSDGKDYYFISLENSNDDTPPSARWTIANFDSQCNLESIEELISSPIFTGAVYNIKSYHFSLNRGGGIFYWDSEISKTLHDGGNIIDPDKTFPSDWTIDLDVQAWYTPDLSGTGCWVRQDIQSETIPVNFGAFAQSGYDDTVLFEHLTSVSDININLDGYTYYVRGDFTVTSNSFILRNGGFYLTLNAPLFTATSPLVKIIGVSVTSGFKEGDSRSSANASKYALSFTGDESNESQFIFKNNTITNYCFGGFRAGNYKNTVVNNNICVDLGNSGIVLAKTPQAIITDNMVKRTYYKGIVITGSNITQIQTIITNNTIEDVYPGDWSPSGAEGVSSHGIGIEVQSLFGSPIVSNNTVNRAHSTGISLSSANHSICVSNNVRENGNTSKSDGYNYRGFAGIECVNSDWSVIGMNNITSPFSRGINIDKSHDCKISENVFHNEVGCVRSEPQYFIVLTGTAANVNNASWGNIITGNIFNNGGENDTIMDDSLCYAVFSSGTFGHLGLVKQVFDNNTVIDCVVSLRGTWEINNNITKSSGLLDLSTSTSWGRPLYDLLNMSAPHQLSNCTYVNLNATKSIGFVRVSTTNNNQVLLRSCEINNTEYVVYSASGTTSRATVINCRFVNVTGYGSGGFSAAFIVEGEPIEGDRITNFPRIFHGNNNTAVISPILGDIVFRTNPSASGQIGWVYTASGWKGFGAIEA